MKHSKQICALLLSAAMVLSLLVILPMTTSAEAATAGSAPITGAIGEGDAVWDGSSTDTSWFDAATYETTTEFYLSSAAQVASFASIVATNDFTGKTVYLTKDIYLNNITEIVSDTEFTRETNHKWTSKHVINSFAGTFDGQGYSVYGLYADHTDNNKGVGFFGNLGSNSPTIKNLNLNYCFVKNGRGGAGMLIGQIGGNKTNVENCHVIGTVSAGWGYAGGLCGQKTSKDTRWFGTIDGCTVRGSVTSVNDEDSSATTNAGAGGIIPILWMNSGSSSASIRNCFVNADINVTHAGHAGGIVGNVITSSKCKLYMRNCAYMGKITAGKEVQDGTTIAAQTAGGLIGRASLNTTTQCHIYMTGCYTAAEFNLVGEGTACGSLVGYLIPGTQNKFTMDSTQYLTGEAGSAASHVGKTDGTLHANAAKAVAITSEALTDGTLLSALNTYALTNSFQPWIQGETAPVHVNQATPSGATMSLASTMQLNIKLAAAEIQNIVDTAAGLEAPKEVSVAVKNANGDGIAAPLTAGYYTAPIETLASEMNKQLSLRMVFTIGDKQYESAVATGYSPLTYLLNIYEKYQDTDAELTTLVTNMMYYGAAAEAGTTIATRLAEKGIAAPVWSEGYQEHVNPLMTEADKTAINAIADTGATLSGGIDITFLMDDAYTTLTVNGKTYTADADGRIVFDGITAGNIRTTFALTFSGEGVDTVTANFTVGNFLESRRANADETALAEATILYMMAARAYVLGTQA